MSAYKLRPEVIYKAEQWKHLKQKKAAPKTFYQNPISKIRYDILQGESIPTEYKIYKEQKAYATHHYAPYKRRLKKMIQPLNNDLLTNGVIDYPLNVQQIIEDLENYFAFYNHQTNKQSLVAETQNKLRTNTLLESDYKKLSQKGKQLYRTLSKEKYLQDSQFIEILENFYQDTITMDKKIKTSGLKDENLGYMKTFLNKLSSYGRRIKGRHLELAAQYTIQEILNKNNVKDVQILDTAKIRDFHLNIGGNLTSYKRSSIVDLGLVFGFKMDDGKTKTLKELIQSYKDIDGKKNSVSVFLDAYQGVGLQAKAAISNKKTKPFNEFSMKLDDVFRGYGVAGSTLQLLNLLIHEKGARSRFHQIDGTNEKFGPIYDNYFNYAISRNVVNILGKENVLIATKNGIQFMDEYVYEDGYYIGVKNPRYYVNIAMANKKLIIGYKRRKK